MYNLAVKSSILSLSCIYSSSWRGESTIYISHWLLSYFLYLKKNRNQTHISKFTNLLLLTQTSFFSSRIDSDPHLSKPVETNIVRTKLSTCENDQYSNSINFGHFFRVINITVFPNLDHILKCLIKMSTNNHKNLRVSFIKKLYWCLFRYIHKRF